MAQEANRDDALKCLEIARKHFAQGNLPGAVKFATKSVALYETAAASAFLAKLTSGPAAAASASSGSSTPRSASSAAPSTSSSSSSSSSSAAPPPASAPGAPRAKKPSTSPAEHRPGLQNRSYTQDQVEAVRKVKACARDYYEVLQISREATEAEVKRAYRKLALQFHPDKNSAPGADEAFKLISKAFAVLSDSDKRAIYDQTGRDPGSRSSAGGGGGGGFQGGNDFDDITPEQLFSMFFDGVDLSGGRGFHSATFMGPGLRHRRFQQRAHHDHNNQNENAQAANNDPFAARILNLVQFLPLLLLLLISFLSSLGPSQSSDDPEFSFEPTAHTPHAMVTSRRSVPYFVDRSRFPTKVLEDPQRRLRFEERVETYFVSALHRSCNRETEYKRQAIRHAESRWIGREQAVLEARKIKTPSCDRLREFES